MSNRTLLAVRVSQITYRASDVHSFRLVSPTGDDLPAFTPGAHVEVEIPNGSKRQYSLHNRAGEIRYYEIGVKLETNGRGGSRFLHKDLRVGDVLTISPPINHFEMVEGASKYVLIGAGIGVTPIIAMARRLTELNADFTLHYCGRSRESLAFLDDAHEICGDKLHLHIDGGDPSRGLNIKRLIDELALETQVYCCGPTPFNAAFRDAMPSDRRNSLHFESFAAAAPVAVAGATGVHEVEVAGTGQVIQIPPDQSVLDALRSGGCEIASSCEVGTCGSCRVRLLEGEVDHQDFVLTDDEQSDWMMVCVSRPKSARIVVDLTPA
jgi:vanillate O-demethylase ferredoxin subunit